MISLILVALYFGIGGFLAGKISDGLEGLLFGILCGILWPAVIVFVFFLDSRTITLPSNVIIWISSGETWHMNDGSNYKGPGIYCVPRKDKKDS